MANLGGRYYERDELLSFGFKKLGKNVKIHERASLYCIENISLGDNVRIDDFSVVIATGYIEIGNFVLIDNYCYLGGTEGIALKDFSTLAPRVSIFTSSDDYSGNFLTNPTVPIEYTGGEKGRVVVSRHVILGTGSVILPGVTVGEGTSVGALSLVVRDLPEWQICAGIPARPIKERSKNLLALERQLLSSQ